MTLEFGIGHDDLLWGTCLVDLRKAWDMVKYLIGSMNSSYDSRRSFASASWVSVSSGSISPIEKAEPMWFITRCQSQISTHFLLETLGQKYSKASYTGFGTRLVVERVRHHSCGPSMRPQHSITEWACWNEMGRSGLNMMKAIARVVPTGRRPCTSNWLESVMS